jgi:hypothetical protein
MNCGMGQLVVDEDIGQVDSFASHTGGPEFTPQVRPYEIYGGQSGKRIYFSRNFAFSLLITIFPVLHVHSYIIRWMVNGAIRSRRFIVSASSYHEKKNSRRSVRTIQRRASLGLNIMVIQGNFNKKSRITSAQFSEKTTIV